MEFWNSLVHRMRIDCVAPHMALIFATLNDLPEPRPPRSTRYRNVPSGGASTGMILGASSTLRVLIFQRRCHDLDAGWPKAAVGRCMRLLNLVRVPVIGQDELYNLCVEHS